jgi:hypothetical protein
MKKHYTIYITLLMFSLLFPFSVNSQIINTVTEPLSASADVKNASAAETSDAFIKLKITGGKAPYTIHCFSPYSLPKQTTGDKLDLNNIKSGDYLFVIQDSGGKSITKEIKISIK